MPQAGRSAGLFDLHLRARRKRAIINRVLRQFAGALTVVEDLVLPFDNVAPGLSKVAGKGV